MSIFEKIRLITLGNIHQLLNAVIDLDSIAAIEQHLRDLQDSYSQLEDQSAEAEGAKRVAERHQREQQGVATGLTTSINAILTDGNPDNDHLTQGLAVRLVNVNKTLTLLTSQVDDAKATDMAIDTAVQQLKLRIEMLNGRVGYLRQLEQAAKAKEQAAISLKKATGVMTSESGVDVDDVEQRLRQRAAAADVKLEQATSGIIDAASANTDLGEAEALLSQMKQNLGLTGAAPDEAAAAAASTYQVTVEKQ